MKQYQHLSSGEIPIKNAPKIQLKNGENCIPQHYLQFKHNLDSVEKIVADISYSDKYPVFVCEDVSGIYIQIGIIGYDNYKPLNKQLKQKIVYGRKWRVEPELPTSEIIQTAFLALKIAREHEIRELFCITQKGKKSTPFNNHHDLPLMSQHPDLFKQVSSNIKKLPDAQSVKNTLESISYDFSTPSLLNMQQLSNGAWLIEVAINLSSNTQLPELESQTLNLVLTSLTENNLYFELMDSFIKLSNQYVEEIFKYQNFHRFSRNNSVLAVGELSTHIRHRNVSSDYSLFSQALEVNNYETDKARVPNLGAGLASQKARAQLNNFGFLSGHLPD